MGNENSVFEGFYNAFLAGEFGNSLAIFVFSKGRLVGADIGGGVYDGVYSTDLHSCLTDVEIVFTMATGSRSITGEEAEAEPVKVEMKLSLPNEIDPLEVHRLETPIGAINARFEKVRDM